MSTIQELETRLQKAPRGLARIHALNALAWALKPTDLPRAEHLAEQAMALIEDSPPGDKIAAQTIISLCVQSDACSQRGEFARALEISAEGLAQTAVKHLPEQRIEFLNDRGWCLGCCGNHAGSIEALHEALRLAREISSGAQQARVLNSIGAIHDIAGNHQDAERALLEAVSLADHATALDRCITLNNLALALAEQGRLDRAYETALESLNVVLNENLDRDREVVLETIGDLCLRKGDADQALRYLDQAITLCRANGSLDGLCVALLHKAQALVDLDRLEQALAAATEGLGIASAIEISRECYLLHACLATIHKARGAWAEAYHHLEMYHQAKEEVLGRETADSLRNLQTAYELEAARKDAEIHQLRNVELQKTVDQLEAALADVKTLSGLVPICACCKKIRTDNGYWQSVEQYVSSHTDAEFSHGICPECAERLYGDMGRQVYQDLTDESTATDDTPPNA